MQIKGLEVFSTIYEFEIGLFTHSDAQMRKLLFAEMGKDNVHTSRTIKDDQTSYAWKSGEILHALTKLKAVALNYEKRARDVEALARCN